MRAVIDSDLWISFLFGKRMTGLLRLIKTRRITVITDERQIDEINDVLSRPKIRRNAGGARVAVMQRFLRRKTMIVTCRRRIRACRDPDDDFLLEIAVEGRADYLVTGDDDLLVLDPFRSVRIVTYKDFKAALPVMHA